MRLDGKVAIITGAGSGMGAEEARLFAAEGARLVLTDVNESAVKSVARDLGADAVALVHDASDEAGWTAVVEEAVRRFGGLDILVNNAAVAGEGSARTLADTDSAFLAKVLDVNVKGVIYGMRAVTGAMKQRGGGAIVNIASGLAFTSLPGYFAYGVSKWAVRGATRLGAKELSPHNIRVVTVTPGAIDTPSLVPSVRENARTFIPLGRAGGADEFARVVLFAVSDDASYVSGAEIMVDGALIC